MTEYGIIGRPLAHTFSPKYFTEKFAREGIEAHYSKFEIPDITHFPQLILSTPNLNGLNVTSPYKEEVMQYLDELDAQTEKMGAVNVIKVMRDGDKIRLKGYNSDMIGFKNSIEPLVDPNIHTKALILGTGGASKAVVFGLQLLGIETRYVSRTLREGGFAYSDLNETILAEYKIIVNATPLGMFPDVDTCPDIPYELLTCNHLLYDLVYNPAETKFLRLGKEQGAATKNGAQMLELQALAAWDIWND